MKLLLDLKNTGKIKYVGLTQCLAEELERSHSVFPVTAIQMEWSLQTRDIEEKIIPMARKLGVGIVTYNPQGRGFQSRKFTKKEKINDWRSKRSRFSEENFEKNVKKCEELEKYSQQKGVTPAQLASAWVHKRGFYAFPKLGTKSVKRLEENSKAIFINLTEQESQEIESLIPDASGSRYDEERMKFTHSFGSI